MVKKRCGTCRKRKPLDHFHRRSASPDGRQNNCKLCSKAIVKRWQQNNPEHFRALMKAWRARHPEHRAPAGEREQPLSQLAWWKRLVPAIRRLLQRKSVGA